MDYDRQPESHPETRNFLGSVIRNRLFTGMGPAADWLMQGHLSNCLETEFGDDQIISQLLSEEGLPFHVLRSIVDSFVSLNQKWSSPHLEQADDMDCDDDDADDMLDTTGVGSGNIILVSRVGESSALIVRRSSSLSVMTIYAVSTTSQDDLQALLDKCSGRITLNYTLKYFPLQRNDLAVLNRTDFNFIFSRFLKNFFKICFRIANGDKHKW
jgi:hypothetical protein